MLRPEQLLYVTPYHRKNENEVTSLHVEPTALKQPNSTDSPPRAFHPSAVLSYCRFILLSEVQVKQSCYELDIRAKKVAGIILYDGV